MRTNFKKLTDTRVVPVYTPVLHFEIKEFIRSLDIHTFLEIGCHFGTDTVDFRNMHPAARIICFEPDPRNLEVIHKYGIDKIAEVYPYALSNENGTSRFYLSSGNAQGRVPEPIYQEYDWSCSSSLKKPTGHLSAHPWITFQNATDVSTIRLDDFDKIDKTTVIDFMWVDVQGAEDIVFSGATDTLRRTRYVYTEYSNRELYERQLTRDQILTLFGESWRVVHDFGGDILLENLNVQDTLNVYFHGFWGGFFDKTNPGTHVGFFIDLLEQVMGCKIIVTMCADNADTLVETLVNTEDSLIDKNPWKYSFLFSGESYPLPSHSTKYSAVLCNKKNKDNIINVPLYIPYLYCNNFNEKLDKIHLDSADVSDTSPIVTIMTNPHGKERNAIFDYIHSRIPIVSSGNHKNNSSIISFAYNTPEFQNFIKQFKFVLACENSVEETYITEKIFHALLSQRVPIYFGSAHVCDYINKDRIIVVPDTSEESLRTVVDKINELLNDQDKYLKMVQQPVFCLNSRTFENIVNDLKYQLFKPTSLQEISQVYCICNENYEKDRFVRLNDMFNTINWPVTFHSPTYKHTISEETFNTYVKTNKIMELRMTPPILKRAELSITLNYLDTLHSILKNYSNGCFLICESDVGLYGDVENINRVISVIDKHDTEWDAIHVGFTPGDENRISNPTVTECDIQLQRSFMPRCMECIIYTYDGVKKWYTYLTETIQYDFSIPLDYLFWNLLRNDFNFHFYWAYPTVFIQRSNAGIEPSNIQNDTY